MTISRRRFERKIGNRRYLKCFFIATEGANTEPQYFEIFNNNDSLIKVKHLKGKHQSAPAKVLDRMQRYLNENGLRKTDEAWLVVDKDSWSNAQLDVLYQWTNDHTNHGLVVSNSKFEYWLLLHFEDGNGIATPWQCSTRLKHYLPDYVKDIEKAKLLPGINKAIERARRRDQPRCQDWPRTTGTTVYRLVEKIMAPS